MRGFLFIIAAFLVSCSENQDEAMNFRMSSLEYSLEDIQYRLKYSKMRMSAYYRENPEKYGAAYSAALHLDTVAIEFNIYIDSLLLRGLPIQNKKDLIERYNTTLEEVDKVRLKNHIGLEHPESILIEERELQIDREVALYLKQNVNLSIYESTEYLSQDMMSGCGFRTWPELSFEFNGLNNLRFNEKTIQKADHRQIQISEILKDGKPEPLRLMIRNVYTFGEIEFDTLSVGNYTIKGEVHMLFGDSWFKVEPFEYDFVVE